MAQQHHGNPNYGMAQQPSQPSRGLMNTQETLLLIYVVDYCEKRGYNESAATLRREGRLQQDTKPPTDSKEGLLYEWWVCFWDVYTARVHPEKSTSTKAAKLYAESLNHPQFGRPRDGGQLSNVRMGGGPPPPGSAAHSAPGVNGQGPSGASYATNPPAMNGIPPPPTTSGAMPGMPGANPSMHNPALQHLQQRMPSYSAQGPGMQMQPVYPQRPPGTQGPAGAPMGTMGQMGPMGQLQQRMPNGPIYAPNPNYRPQPGQESPQQQHEMQTTGTSGSPKQPGAPSTAQNSSPHLQGANGNAYDASGMEQGTPRNQPSRGQKRPSPAEDDQYSKDASPPDRKRFKKSPQENGPALPTTPSLAPAQPQPGNGRPPPMQTFNGMTPNKPNPMMGGMSFPAQGMMNGPPLGGQGMPPAMAGQLRELTPTHSQHMQRAQGAMPHPTHQTDQQYLNQIQQTAITTYNINKPTHPPLQNPTLTGPSGVAAEPAVRGATNPPKGSMLPPPPPNSSTGQSAPGTGNSTPGKGTPVMSGLQPRNASNKDSSSPGEGVSPESSRPGSRPIPGSTPQMMPAPIPGTVSTPGGPSAISAPSPSQIATPQQISRPQTQSPSQASLVRPSSATTNGLPGIGGPPPNPSAILARYGGGAPPGGMNGAAGGALAGSTPSNAGMGSSNDMLVGGPLTNDLFMSLNNNVPFDLQMMGYQEDDSFTANMGLDFGANFGMDESYHNMSMYINDSSLDNGA